MWARGWSAALLAALALAMPGPSFAAQLPKLVSISVSPVTPTLVRGTNQQFEAVGSYSDSSTRDVTAKAHWTSSHAAVIAIGKDGMATALDVGSATITAKIGKIQGASTATVDILTRITVEPATAYLIPGVTLQYRATGDLSGGGTADVTHLVTWADTNTVVASISADGLATPHEAGGASIVAYIGALLSNTATLTVVIEELGPPDEWLEVTPATPTTTSGSVQFAATLHVADGISVDVTFDDDTTWSSSDVGVATVSSTGLASPVAPGTTTITATFVSLVSGEYQEVAVLTVNDGP